MKSNTSCPMSSNIATMPTTSEPVYSYTIPRTQDVATPYSAVSQVSSFNPPPLVNGELHTPVSMTHFPPLPIKSLSNFERGYDMFGIDDEDHSPRSCGPMKQKYAYNPLRTNMSSSSLPDSENFCNSPPPMVPYFGSFGVSAPPREAQSLAHPRSIPQIQTSQSIEMEARQHFHPTTLQTAASFRSHPAPLLIAPNPHSLRPATSSYAPNPVTLTRSPPSLAAQHATYSPPNPPLSSPTYQQVRSSRNRQKKGESSNNDYQTVMSVPELRTDLSDLELLILELRYKDGLSWKEVAVAYSRKHGKKTQVPALQMRRRRLMERLWEKACEISKQTKDTAKWDKICDQIQKYAPSRRSSREMDEKKWLDAMPTAYSTGGASYDTQAYRRERNSSDLTTDSYDQESWSSHDSPGNSLHDSESDMSSVAMNANRSRAAIHSPSMQLQLQQHRYQQHQAHQYHDSLYRPRSDGWSGF